MKGQDLRVCFQVGRFASDSAKDEWHSNGRNEVLASVAVTGLHKSKFVWALDVGNGSSETRQVSNSATNSVRQQGRRDAVTSFSEQRQVRFASPSNLNGRFQMHLLRVRSFPLKLSSFANDTDADDGRGRMRPPARPPQSCTVPYE